MRRRGHFVVLLLLLMLVALVSKAEVEDEVADDVDEAGDAEVIQPTEEYEEVDLSEIGVEMDEDLEEEEPLDMSTEDLDDYHQPEVLDQAFIVATQRSLKPTGVVGKNMTVVIDIFNAGRSSAVKATLQLPNLNWTQVELVEGPAEDVPEISPGNRLNVTYVVKPKLGGNTLVVPEVHIRYALSEVNTDKFQVTRSTLLVTYIASLQEVYKGHLLLAGRIISANILKTTEDWVNFAVGGSILAVLLLCYVTYMNFTSSVRQAKRARAQKYLEELKDE